MQRDSEEWRGRCGQVLRAASWVEGAQGGLLIDLYDVPENCFSKAYAKPGNWFRPGLPAKGPEVDRYRSPPLEGGRLGLSPSSAPTNYRASAKSPEVSVSLPVKSGAFATLTVCPHDGGPGHMSGQHCGQLSPPAPCPSPGEALGPRAACAPCRSGGMPLAEPLSGPELSPPLRRQDPSGQDTFSCGGRQGVCVRDGWATSGG